MKRIFQTALAVAALAIPSAALAGINTTPHDLSSGSTETSSVNGAQDALCVYCHTPHVGAAATALWNRTASGALPGWTAADETLQGTPLPDTATADLNQASARCMSCHDGTTAVGDIINKQGRGFGTAAEAGADTNVVTTATNALSVLGANLGNTGTHPVSVGYRGSGNSEAITSEYRATSTACIGSALCTTQNSNIRLYNDATDGDTVECGSCHDPHTDAQSTFLRFANTGSNLCLACHNK